MNQAINRGLCIWFIMVDIDMAETQNQSPEGVYIAKLDASELWSNRKAKVKIKTTSKHDLV